MSQIIPIYIPTYISSVDYQPARVLPRLLFYNGQVDCETFYVKDENNAGNPVRQFPYFDNYNTVGTNQFPTTGSKSLLFFNESSAYGEVPFDSLYSDYWQTYVELLYNPRTRLMNASAIIPLADYFKMELNDVVQFRGNYYHLRAINDYNLKNGECQIQLLGPILPQALPFDQPVIPTTTTTTSTSTTTTSTTSTTTTTTTTALTCTQYTFDGNITHAGLTAFWVDCETGITQSQFVPADTTYGPVCARTGTANGQAYTTLGDCTPSTTTTTSTTTAGGTATLAWTYTESGGALGYMDIYVNGSIVESRSNTSSGTYPVNDGDVINVEVRAEGCGGASDHANAYCTGIINDADCVIDDVANIFTAIYTVTSGDIGTTLNLNCYSLCSEGCV